MKQLIAFHFRQAKFIGLVVVLLALTEFFTSLFATPVPLRLQGASDTEVRQWQQEDWRAILLVTGANLVLAMWNGYITRNVRKISEKQKGSLPNAPDTIVELCNPSWRFCGMQFLRKLAANRRR